VDHTTTTTTTTTQFNKMTVHSFHVFDRKGKTLFTKRYSKIAYAAGIDEEHLAEQRKLIFGMIFSLRELSASLSPYDGPGDLHLVKTGASTLYHFETVSGLKFALYTTPETSYQNPNFTAPAAGQAVPMVSAQQKEGMTNQAMTDSIRDALRHIYEHIWVTFVVRSPMYRATNPDVSSTNFEASLDNYLKGMAWFK
jgi:trafficking protein particle complex subunit 1